MTLGDNTIGGRVQLDTSDFQGGVAGVNRSLRILDAEFKNTSEQIKATGSEIDLLENKMTYLNAKIEQQEQKVKHYAQRFEESKQKQQEMRQSCERLATSMEQLEKEIQESTQAYGKNAQETKQLREEYKKLEAEYKQNEQSLKRLNATVDRNAIAFNKAEADLHRFRNELGDTEAKVEELNNATLQLKNRMGDLGGQMQDTGSKIAEGFGVAAVGAAVGVGALIVNAVQFEEANKKVQTGLGLTREESEKVSKVSKSVWREGYGQDLASVSDALVKVKRNIKDINDDETLKQITRDSTILAEVMESDVNEVTRGASQLMNRFGLSSKEAFDLLAQGSVSGLNYSNELFDNLAEYGPLFEEMGFSAEEMFDILANGSQNGAYNLDYINDVMKEFQIRIKDGSKSTNEAMAEMSDSTQAVWDSFLKGESTAKDVFNAVLNELKVTDDQIKVNQLGVALFGTKWEDLESTTMLSLNNMEKGIGDYSGAMNKMVDGYDTNAKKWASVTRQLREAFEPLGEVILEVAEDAIPTLEGSIEGVSKWFKSLDEDTQKTLGTALLLTPAILGVTAALGVLTFAIGAIMANPIVATIAGVTLGIGALGFAFTDLGKKVEKAEEDSRRFGEGVSESTKKAIGSYVELKEQAFKTLDEIPMLTGEKAKEAVQRAHEEFGKLADESIQAINKDKGKFQAHLESWFAGETDPAILRAKEKILNDQMEIYKAQEEAVIKANETIQRLLSQYNGQIHKMSQADKSVFLEAIKSIDSEIGKSAAKSVDEIQKISKAMDNFNKNTSVETIQGKVKELGKEYTNLSNDLDKARQKEIEFAKSKITDTEGQKAAISQINAKYSEQSALITEGYLQQMKQAEEVLRSKGIEMDLTTGITKAEADKISIQGRGIGEYVKNAEIMESKNESLFKRLEERAEKERAIRKKNADAVKEYGESLIATSTGLYDTLFQTSREKALELGSDIAFALEDGTKAVHLGEHGQVKVDEFVEGIKTGKYKAQDVAVALINTMRVEMGNQPLTAEGVKAMNSFAEGLKQMNAADIANQLNLDLKENLELDLGPLGKMNTVQFVNGLKEGTVGIDAVFIFFHQQLEKLNTTDLSKDGTQIMATLKTGMEMGFLGVEDVLNRLGVSLEDQTKYDLKGNGQITIASLVQGLQNGQFSVDQALEVIRQIVVQKSDVDTTQQGANIPSRTAAGIRQTGQQPVDAANEVKRNVEQTLGVTTDGGGGAKSGSQLAGGILSQRGYIQGSALDVVATAHSGFNTINGNPAGTKGASGVGSGILSQRGHIRGSALDVVANAHGGFNTINGTTAGAKGGSDFASGLGSKKGSARSSGSDVASSAKSGLESVKANSAGTSFAAGFISGMSKEGSAVKSAAAGLAVGALQALKSTLNMNSPSRLTRDQGGKPFGQGFALGIGQTASIAEEESSKLALKANSALASGIKNNHFILKDAMQGTVSDALNGAMSVSLQEKMQSVRAQLSSFKGFTRTDTNTLAQWRDVLMNQYQLPSQTSKYDNNTKGFDSTVIHIGQMVVREEADIKKIVDELERRKKYERRAFGEFAYD